MLLQLPGRTGQLLHAVEILEGVGEGHAALPVRHLLHVGLFPGLTAHVVDLVGGDIVCCNDEIANSLLLQLRKRGLRVPEDIAIVSFDNSFYSELSPAPITSLSHGGENAGRTAAQTLLRQMAGEYCQSVQLPWVLVERESSRLSKPPKSAI